MTRRAAMTDPGVVDRLPELLGEALARRARQGPGRFTVIDTETGLDVDRDGRLHHWFVGVIDTVWGRVVAAAGAQSPPHPPPPESPPPQSEPELELDEL